MTWAHDTCRRMVARAVPEKPHMADDAMGEMVDRADRVHDTFVSALGSLDNHMKTNLRWYVFKLLRRYLMYDVQVRVRELTLEDENELRDRSPDATDCSRVLVVMRAIDEFDRLVLVMRHVRELTFQQMADELGVSRNTARNYYAEAMSCARAAAEAQAGEH